MGQLLRLGVEIALPGELADGGETEPDKQVRPAVARVTVRLDQLVAQIVAVHQRPAVVAHFAFDDAFDQRRAVVFWFGELNVKILAAIVFPAARFRAEQNEDYKRRERIFVEPKDNPLLAVRANERSLHRQFVKGAGLSGPDRLGRQLPRARTPPRLTPVQDIIRAALQPEGEFDARPGRFFFDAEPEVFAVCD